MENRTNKKKVSSILTGCSMMLLIPMLLCVLLVISMCRVPKEKYEPYVSFGETYFQTVLDIKPKITHSLLYGDEGGGFDVTIQFTKEQYQKPLTKLYLKNNVGREYSFRGSSTESQIIDISKKENILLQQQQVYSELNEPVEELLDDLLSEGNFIVSTSIYSTDLDFWREFLENYDLLKTKSYDDRIEWLEKNSKNADYEK